MLLPDSHDIESIIKNILKTRLQYGIWGKKTSFKTISVKQNDIYLHFRMKIIKDSGRTILYSGIIVAIGQNTCRGLLVIVRRPQRSSDKGSWHSEKNCFFY